MDGDELLEDEFANKGDSEPPPRPDVVVPATRWKAEFFPLPIRLGRGGGDEFSLDESGCSSYLQGCYDFEFFLASDEILRKIGIYPDS